MSEYELTSLIYELFRDMDSMIEFWMTATFAVVVAVFVGRRHLSRRMLLVMAGLYLIASLQWSFRWALFLYRILQYRDQLVQSGYPDIPTNNLIVGAITVLLIAVFVVGVVATMIFVVRSNTALPDAVDSSDQGDNQDDDQGESH